MNFGFVPAPIPKHIWDAAAALLAPAIERAGQTDLAEVLADLQAGRAQLWVARDDAVRMAGVTARHGDCCHVWLLGGSADFRAIAETVKAAARDAGMTAMSIDGRPGWRRVFSDWTVNGDVLEVAI